MTGRSESTRPLSLESLWQQPDAHSRMFVFVEETECQAALTDWLLKYGEQTYYDRLARALQHIGRTDIAIGENYTKAAHKLI